MNKKGPKKLKLHSETVRQLASRDLHDIAGGATRLTCQESCPAYYSCPWYETCI